MRLIEVVKLDSGEVIHTINVTGKSDAHVERAMEGMMINIDLDRYAVRDTAEE
jgi:hypothetical protein